ncbi:MAG: GatB/YqeY domain-containing protein [Bradymonadia bacterium]
MSIDARLTQQMKDAMRAKDRRTLDVVRMVKSRMKERTTQKGFTGEVNDALWLEVIEAYVKSLKKGVGEFEKVPEGEGQEQIDQLNWEIALLQAYLPAKADEAQTKAWVDEAIAGLGGPEGLKAGQVMGVVMKGHKKEVDAALVRSLVEAALNG